MKQNSKSPAGTNVQQSDAIEASSVSPTCTKPLVECSQSPRTQIEPINKKVLSKLVFDKPFNVGTVTIYEQVLKYCPPFCQSPPI